MFASGVKLRMGPPGSPPRPVVPLQEFRDQDGDVVMVQAFPELVSQAMDPPTGNTQDQAMNDAGWVPLPNSDRCLWLHSPRPFFRQLSRDMGGIN